MQSAVHSYRSSFSRSGFKRAMLPLVGAGILFCSPCVVRAADAGADLAMIQLLETKASLAAPREQCFLYTELVNHMTDLASHQLAAGDLDKASETIKKINLYAERIQMGVADDAKKLKKAEILLRETDQRLNSIMRASGDNRSLLQATMKRLQTVHTELLAAIFKH